MRLSATATSLVLLLNPGANSEDTRKESDVAGANTEDIPEEIRRGRLPSWIKACHRIIFKSISKTPTMSRSTLLHLEYVMFG